MLYHLRSVDLYAFARACFESKHRSVDVLKCSSNYVRAGQRGNWSRAQRFLRRVGAAAQDRERLVGSNVDFSVSDNRDDIGIATSIWPSSGRGGKKLSECRPCRKCIKVDRGCVARTGNGPYDSTPSSSAVGRNRREEAGILSRSYCCCSLEGKSRRGRRNLPSANGRALTGHDPINP